MLMVVIKKELARVFTNRRLVFSSFILPALSIFILYSLMGTMMENLEADVKEHVTKVVAVNAPENFQKLVTEGSGTNYQFITGTEKEANNLYQQEIKEGNLDVLVVFPTDFEEKVTMFQDGENKANIQYPNISVYYNPSEDYSDSGRHSVKSQLRMFEESIIAERIGSYEALTAFIIDDTHKISEEGREAGVGLASLLPMLLTIMLFAGAMGMGMDSIAGEKERGTMATILVTPVDRTTIAFGKVISLAIVAVISATTTIIAVIASMSNADFLAQNADLGAISYGIGDFGMLFAVLVVQVLIFVCLICLVSIHAKSMKEAGTYTSPIYMIVMIAAFVTMFTRGEVAYYNYFIPVLGNVYAVKEILTFDLTMVEFVTTVGMSTIAIVVMLKLISAAFNSEKTMFNS